MSHLQSLGTAAYGLKITLTYGIVFQHAHHGRCPRPPERVEEAGHGHGDKAYRDDARLRCKGAAYYYQPIPQTYSQGGAITYLFWPYCRGCVQR